ncbi:3-hydroxyacyl-CoA dehydrogenase [Microbacterium protaetiae]|uniref:3-hydroxyacyl-CoA dehydrogenase n=1 Tax=Microbacterium protaetiae TaxID=2509458 RepID=A0A4P6ENW8_9MICO|nr:3-hydroxyacyl-CoA dehydrogenase [Microbacterium protaetiae]QAY59608.1 3-hydroxyacyl-CoA dehydrogenase [Microbacterium protaetiae]
MNDITVLGTGVLGSQIAFQTAYSGYAVVAYDVSDEVLETAKNRFAKLAKTYARDLGDQAKADAALERIRYSADLADAVAQADLVIEAVPEKLELKREVYTKLGEVAPAKTIFATNSSTLLPSAIAEFTGRPERFLALHFANQIWVHNTAEIMGHPGTDPQVYDEVVAFATSIGMVPIQLHKERSGYVLNSLLVPLLNAAGDLLVEGIASPEDIDAVWRIGTGAPQGPFQIFDVVGLTTAYNISAAGGEKQQAFAKLLKENYIDQGKLGIATGEGFYSYK